MRVIIVWILLDRKRWEKHSKMAKSTTPSNAEQQEIDQMAEIESDRLHKQVRDHPRIRNVCILFFALTLLICSSVKWKKIAFYFWMKRKMLSQSVNACWIHSNVNAISCKNDWWHYIMDRTQDTNQKWIIPYYFSHVIYMKMCQYPQHGHRIFLHRLSIGREEDSATVAAKGNDYKFNGRTKNPNVGIGWTHKKGKVRRCFHLLKPKHRNSVPLNVNVLRVSCDLSLVFRIMAIDGDRSALAGCCHWSQTEQRNVITCNLSCV